MKRLNIIFISLLAMVCTVLSCSDDSVEDKDIQKIDPVGQLEVYKTSREKEILVKFIRTNYVKDIQIEIAYRNTESGENGEWTTIVLNGDNYKYGGNYLLQVPAEGTYEVAITLIGANELRSESKSQLASTFEYVKTSMFDCAHSMMTCVIKYYYHKGPRTCWQTYYPKEQGYWDGDAVVWGQGGGLSAFVALREASVDTEQEEYYRSLEDDMFKGIQHFWVTDHGRTAYSVYPDSGNDRFYDDNDWLAIDFCDLYALTKNKKYLEKAQTLYNYIYSGWDDVLGGGIYWCEQKKTSKNTCSNAPAAVLCMKLYNLTKDNTYLEQAKKTYDWTKNSLRDPEDFVYWDNVRLDGSVDKAKYTYNSGQMIQAGVLLYQQSGDKAYLKDAQETARGAYQRFTEVRKAVDGTATRFYTASPWFNVILLRGLTALYEVDHNPEYIRTMADNARYAWDHTRDVNGFLDNDWTGIKTKEHKWLLDNACMVELFSEINNIK